MVCEIRKRFCSTSRCPTWTPSCACKCGRRSNSCTSVHDSHARGTIVELTLAHTRADLTARCLRGSLTRQSTYAAAGASLQTISVGGGLRNRSWVQATSDVSGLSQSVRQINIGASYGDAFLARLAIGGVSRSSIKSWNPAAYTIEPDLNNADVYRRRYATFLDLYPRIRDLMVDLDV